MLKPATLIVTILGEGRSDGFGFGSTLCRGFGGGGEGGEGGRGGGLLGPECPDRLTCVGIEEGLLGFVGGLRKR
jgi:hypothetical protein